eukprot:TRINITY_DN70545_c0_g1_i1.p1 TRINITY_DN70545_c0_g1~~TRINITY_DN70545_c0_g1_i1.p1  ORF type:complete len:1058 (+),score=233.69 TRINITY_DN70545_c0_g1_i1:69-3176(+)
MPGGAPAVLLLAVALPAARPALRIIVHQEPHFHARRGRFWSDCANVSQPGCFGGAAALAAVMRSEAMGADAAVRLVGVDVNRITSFHPDGWAINELLARRLGVDVTIMDTAFPLTGDGFESVLSWMVEARRPLVVTNHATKSPHTFAADMYLNRAAIVDAGGIKVGVVVAWPAGSFLPTVPLELSVPAMVHSLRHGGADLVFVVCADRPEFWRPHGVRDYAGLGGDVVLPPHCGGSAGCADVNESLLINATWVVPSLRRGQHPDPGGDYVGVFDFARDEEGALRPTGARAVPLLEGLPAALQGEAYRADLDWAQLQVDRALANDPRIGHSTAPMPAGRIRNGSVSDEVCRRDLCPIGVFVLDTLRSRFPGYDAYMWNGGAMRLGWDAGPVTVGDVYGMMPFSNGLCSFNTTGTELWRHFERFAANIAADGAYSADGDTEARPGGFPQTRGVRFEFDPARPPMQRLVRLDLERAHPDGSAWEPLVRTRYYSVLTSEFLCSGGDGYDLAQRELHAVPAIPQDIIIEYIRQAGDSGFMPPNATSIVFINDSRPTVRLPPLAASDCGSEQRFLPQWSACVDCPDGMVADPVDSRRCAFPAMSGADMVWLWVVIAFGALVALVAPPVAWRLTTNWRRIRRLHSREQIAINCAESIAAMRLEEVAYIRKIQNPDRIQRAFIDIIKALTEYRTFLPHSVLVAQIPEDFPEASTFSGAPPDATLVSVNPVQSFGVPTAGRRSVSPRPRFSGSDLSSLGSSGALSTSVRNFNVDSYFARKVVSMVWTGTSGVHEYCDVRLRDGQVSAAYFHALLGATLQAVDASRGVIDHISGDRTAVSFGAARPSSDQLSAPRCALAIAESVRSVGGSPHVGTERGCALVGTVGTEMTRKHTILGPVVNVAYACSRIARQHGVAVLSGRRMAEESGTEVQSWALCALGGAKVGRTISFATVLYEIVRIRPPQDAQEWMYQMQKAEGEDAYAVWNRRVRSATMHAIDEHRALPAGLQYRGSRSSTSPCAPDREAILESLISSGPYYTIPVDVAF